MSLPACPKCNESFTYEEGHLYICPMCFHEWDKQDQEAAEEALITRDANGNQLNDGDDVTVIQDLKMGKDVIKQGAKAKSIRILEVPVDGHDIQGRIDGFGTLYLKSSVVKK
ncbi:MAG: alkylphosphonate utilization protein [Clostridiaceae bacterium]|nr:zinc ribbon domain-containing protein YjdM [Bacillota bacterium]NLN51565.1 alkylphosphonate utilization protein [Clostridiaceae bacterium]